jgi:hypothetical protein
MKLILERGVSKLFTQKNCLLWKYEITRILTKLNVTSTKLTLSSETITEVFKLQDPVCKPVLALKQTILRVNGTDF